mmetsp:Transcript_65653/g.153605  ORF Transcript_65653/g.153605 Transcript_65653/m.153605 type:complete len:221 (-) Transcript_65653:505-1167(-)
MIRGTFVTSITWLSKRAESVALGSSISSTKDGRIPRCFQHWRARTTGRQLSNPKTAKTMYLKNHAFNGECRRRVKRFRRKTQSRLISSTSMPTSSKCGSDRRKQMPQSPLATQRQRQKLLTHISKKKKHHDQQRRRLGSTKTSASQLTPTSIWLGVDCRPKLSSPSSAPTPQLSEEDAKASHSFDSAMMLRLRLWKQLDATEEANSCDTTIGSFSWTASP